MFVVSSAVTYPYHKTQVSSATSLIVTLLGFVKRLNTERQIFQINQMTPSSYLANDR